MSPKEGWQGWDEYAPFYDWENARTLGRRDVPFWRRVALARDGRCSSSAAGPAASRCRSRGPASRWSASIDRRRCSTRAARRLPALAQSPAGRAAALAARARRHPRAAVRAPARSRWCSRPTASCSRCCAIAISPRRSTSVARVLEPGGLFGLDLVPDVPQLARVHEPRPAARPRRAAAPT